jgi:hypothetical protein
MFASRFKSIKHEFEIYTVIPTLPAKVLATAGFFS